MSNAITNQEETKVKEEPKELKIAKKEKMKMVGAALETLVGAGIVGLSGFALGQDNLPGYSQAINGGVLVAGGIMVVHSTYKAADIIDSLYATLKEAYKKD